MSKDDKEQEPSWMPDDVQQMVSPNDATLTHGSDGATFEKRDEGRSKSD